MSEYIIEWSGIGARITELMGSETPCLAVKHLRKERLREPIVRCKDCAYICNREYANGLEFHTCSYFDSEHAEVEPDSFCSWGERKRERKRQ